MERTIKISSLLVLPSLHFFQIWDVTFKKDNAKCNDRHISNVCARQRMHILGKLTGENRIETSH